MERLRRDEGARDKMLVVEVRSTNVRKRKLITGWQAIYEWFYVKINS